MARYVAVRLYAMALTLVGLSLLVFLMLRLVARTVVEQMIGADAIVSPAMVAELKRFFGLDQPWWVQYGRWIGNLAQGELGTSWRAGKTAADSAGVGVRADPRHPRRHPLGAAPQPGDRQRHPGGDAARALDSGVLAGHDADPVLLHLPALDAAGGVGRLFCRPAAQPHDHAPAGPLPGHGERGQHR